MEIPINRSVDFVYYVKADGTMEQVLFSQKERMIQFTTSHFSTYVLVYKLNGSTTPKNDLILKSVSPVEIEVIEQASNLSIENKLNTSVTSEQMRFSDESQIETIHESVINTVNTDKQEQEKHLPQTGTKDTSWWIYVFSVILGGMIALCVRKIKLQ